MHLIALELACAVCAATSLLQATSAHTKSRLRTASQRTYQSNEKAKYQGNAKPAHALAWFLQALRPAATFNPSVFSAGLQVGNHIKASRKAAAVRHTRSLDPIMQFAKQSREAIPSVGWKGQSLSFDELRELSERVERLTSVERDYLMSFWSDKLNSFQIVPNEIERPSLMSSCSVLQLIFNNQEHWKGVARWEKSDSHRVSVESMVEALMDSSWTGDAFQTPKLLITLSTSKSIDKDDPKYIGAVHKLLEQRARVSLHRKQSTSSYLRYRNVLALLTIQKQDMVPSEIAATNEIAYAIERGKMVAFDELTRQLAFYYSDDSTNFDVITLGFTLLTYYLAGESVRLSSQRGVLYNTNMNLIKQALFVLFSEQYSDGTFRKGEPIMTSLDSRDIGNAYVFFFDMMQELLQLPMELLVPYLPNLERCLQYAENNIVREVLPEMCDGSTGTLCQVQGWKSNYQVSDSPVCWATANVFGFLERFRVLLRTLITNNVLLEFNGKTKEDVLLEKGSRMAWSKLLDADLSIGETKSSLKKEIFDRVLLPQLQKEVSQNQEMLSPGKGGEPSVERIDVVSQSMPTELYDAVDAAGSASNLPPLYSLILFGPPGTAKTTIVETMASTLNWNFVTIDTAAFLADGLGNIARRMTYVFEKLKCLKKTIILFDEIEEFCLNREDPGVTMESRLLTTAMLTQLNALRREQTNIFVVATNRLRSFDAAVIRPGRFDMLLFVGTPNQEARQSRLVGKLASSGVTAQQTEMALPVMAKIWGEDWEELRFFTFAENERLMNDIVALLRSAEFNEQSVRQKIQDIERTSTIQGAVKKDYVESEVLSRL